MANLGHVPAHSFYTYIRVKSSQFEDLGQKVKIWIMVLAKENDCRDPKELENLWVWEHKKQKYCYILKFTLQFTPLWGMFHSFSC